MNDNEVSRLDPRRLFLIGNLSIFMIGLGFAVRANIAPDIQQGIFDQIDLATSGTMIARVLGATFTGFALTLLFGSALVDYLGMKRMLSFSAFGYILGSVVVVAVSFLPVADSSYCRPTDRPPLWSIRCGASATPCAENGSRTIGCRPMQAPRSDRS